MASIFLRNISTGLLLVSVINIIASELVTTHFTAVQEMSDKIDDSGFLQTFFANSAIECSLACVVKCRCFGYNKNRVCRLHEQCVSTALTIQETGWRYYRKEAQAIDCKDWYMNKGARLSGIYTTSPTGSQIIQVFCDMDTLSGGWTVILKRSDGSVNFTRNYEDYKIGFGNISNEYWIGNQLIHTLTNYQPSELYIVITDIYGVNFYELYDQVYVSSEEDGFRILLGNSMGTLGNAMMPSESKFQQNGSRFTTIDKDQDEFPENCAVRFGGGGWWYKSCYKAQLTGQYGTTEWAWPWYPTFTDGTTIKTVKMMLRRKA